jgi:hypothetical protein
MDNKLSVWHVNIQRLGEGLHATAMPYCHTELAQKNRGKMGIAYSSFLLIPLMTINSG